MFRDLAKPIFFDTIITAILIGILLRNAEPVKACSPKLFGVGVGFCAYLGSFVLRNVFLLFTCYFSRKPDSFACIGRSCFAAVDCICLTGFTIWATIVLFNSQTDECVQSSPRIKNWWITCVVAMAISWFYSAIVLVVCSVVMPVVACFICCICMFGLSRARQMQDRIPIANAVIKQLENSQKLFTDLKD